MKTLIVSRPSFWVASVLACLLWTSSGSALPPQARQFDFWLGGWDVNLRIRANGAWPPSSVKAKAHIYSILDGKAVLELWDSAPIKGFSVRYFDVDRDKWLLWLNWPNANRSGSSGLSGAFHHGRGDFFSETATADGGTRLARYSFNDITPTSLRWDDAYSSDGGENWWHQWIMEFSRTAPTVELDPAGGSAHTQGSGGRCTLPEFRRFDAIVGRREGSLRLLKDGSWQSSAATLTGYQVLDDCVVLAFLKSKRATGTFESFHQLTWNSFASTFEETVLDNRPTSQLAVYYGADTNGELVLSRRPAFEEEITPRRRVWRVNESGVEIEELVANEAGEWSPVAKAQFDR